MAAEGALSLDWPLFWTIAGGLVTAGLTTWLTAFLSFRSNVRQHVWQSVYQEKREEIRKFSNFLFEFEFLLNLLRNLQDGLRLEPPMQVGRAIFVLKVMPDNAITAPHLDNLKQHILDIQKMQEGNPKAPNLPSKISYVYGSLRGLCILQLDQKLSEIYSQVGRLTLLCYSPQAIKNVADRAADLVFRTGTTFLPFDGMDIEKEILDFQKQMHSVLFEMRQDLKHSARSLAKAMRHSPEWEK